MKPRFPGYDVVSRAGTWDRVTAGVVLARLAPPPPLRFFTVAEERIARPLLDRLLAQDGPPDDESRLPVLESIDARLAEGETDGWHHDDLPEDGETWRRCLAALDEDALAEEGAHFWALKRRAQNRLLERVRTAGVWHGMPAGKLWNLWIRYAVTAFYSHPWAWNEMGFGGPAYPRGYKALGLDRRENWEVREVDAEDPEPWARRVEAARGRQDGDE